VLLLQNQIEIHKDYTEVTLEHLIQLVANRVFESNPPLEDEALQANQQKQLDDLIKILPRLQYGLDVNVRFQSIVDFEFTEEMAIFDMLDITLAHGWLIDPQDTETSKVVGSLSYNQVVEKLITYRSIMSPGRKNDPDQVPLSPLGTPCQSTRAPSRSGGADSAGGPVEGNEGPKVDLEQEIFANSFSAAIDESRPQSKDLADQHEEEQRENLPSQEDNDNSHQSKQGELHQESKEVTPSQTLERTETPVELFTQAELSSPSPTPQDKGSPAMNLQVDMKSVASPKLRQPSRDELLEGAIVEQFINKTASQLTYFGLLELHNNIRERQLCVFFRNNHFCTLFKDEGKLYLLVTDLGYQHEYDVIWEKLDEIDGDTEYVNGNFKAIPRRLDDTPGSLPDHIIDPDYLMALQIQQSEDGDPSGSAVVPSEQQNQLAGGQGMIMGNVSAQADDSALAEALQNEELMRVQQQESQQQRVNPQPPDSGLGSMYPTHEDGTPYSEEEVNAMMQQEQYYKQLQQQQRSRPAGSGGRSTNKRSPKSSKCSIQ